MLNLLCGEGIIDEYSQKMILGAALIQKRNLKSNINSLNELKPFLDDEMKRYFRALGNKTVTIFNKLQKYSEEELVDAVVNMKDAKTPFDMQTPDTEAELIDYLLNIEDGSEVLDLYSGYGKMEEILFKNHKNIKICGMEISNSTVEIARLRMFALKNYNAGYARGDILTTNFAKTFEYSVADIPFLSRYDIEVQKALEQDCQKLNIQLSGRISVTWITIIKILTALKENGRAVIATMKGSLFNTLDREIRKIVIERGYIEDIVDLPGKILPFANTDISLIVLNKSKKNKNIKFIDLTKCSQMKGKINIIDLEKAKGIIANESVEVSISKIRDNNFSLNYNIYSGNVEIDNGKQLGEITWDIFRGYQITSTEINKMLVENKEEMNYKILEISDINDEGKICSELKMINSGKRNLDRYLLQNGDIVISARGDKVKKCLINIGYDEKIIANGSINVIRADQNKLNPIFLKAFLDSEKGIISLNNIKSGVTIPSINVGELKKIIIPCPPLKEQDKVAQKIKTQLELIKSTAKRLEELKQELKNISDLI